MEKLINTLSLKCPEPLIEVQLALASDNNAYQIITIYLDDPSSRLDICRLMQHKSFQLIKEEAVEKGEFRLIFESRVDY